MNKCWTDEEYEQYIAFNFYMMSKNCTESWYETKYAKHSSSILIVII